MPKDKKRLITKVIIANLQLLANIKLPEPKTGVLAESLAVTLDYASVLQQAKIDKHEPTNQVTGLTNVWREDVVDNKRQLDQTQALKNARNSHNGYFVVPQILE